MTADSLKPSRPRLMIVEDEFMIADHLAVTLDDLGYETVGPVSTVDAALGMIASQSLDGVLLDVNLKGVSSAPVAAELAIRNIPFVVVTGYGNLELPSELEKGAARLSKPYNVAELGKALESAFSR